MTHPASAVTDWKACNQDTVVLGVMGMLKGMTQRHSSFAIVGALEYMAAHRSALDAANDEWQKLHRNESLTAQR